VPTPFTTKQKIHKQMIENINKDKDFNLDDVMMSYSEKIPEKPDLFWKTIFDLI